MEMLERARDFIYQNARPVDLARWNYHFEDGDQETVIRYLTAYQNPDGGFGHGLEADCWNPKSSPMQTWVATRILKEIRLEDPETPIVRGILNYLGSGAEYDGHRWHGLNTVVSNNDAPRAPWWTQTEEQELCYNPTASLIGFILNFARKDEPIYELGCSLVKEAYAYYVKNMPLESFHEAACFVELYEYLRESGLVELVDLEEFRKLLQQQISTSITEDVSVWSSAYVCKPSLFLLSPQSDLYPGKEAVCSYECDFIKETQQEDGTWNVTWGWSEYPEEWPISKNWWKSDIIIKNLLFIKNN